MVEIRLIRTKEGENPSVAARRLLASALETAYGIPAASCLVEKDEKGKPYLAGRPDLHISISHSGPYAACAFGDKPVGIDIEMWRTHSKWQRIVDKMHPGEREAMTRLCGGTISRDTAEPVRQFCDLWVRKESFLKAVGEGLRLSLDAFDTTGDMVSQDLREGCWYIKSWQLPEEALSVAVCGQEELDFSRLVW